MLKMKPWIRTTQTKLRKIKHNDFHTTTTKSQANFSAWFQRRPTTVENFVIYTVRLQVMSR